MTKQIRGDRRVLRDTSKIPEWCDEWGNNDELDQCIKCKHYKRINGKPFCTNNGE